MSGNWSQGSTAEWRRIRRAVLLRDGWRCKIALPGTWRNRKGELLQCRDRADCVHHTHGRGVTGDDMRYMVAACSPCNLKIGDPTKLPDPPHLGVTKW